MIQRRYLTLFLLFAIFFGSVYAAAQIGGGFEGFPVEEVLSWVNAGGSGIFNPFNVEAPILLGEGLMFVALVAFVGLIIPLSQILNGVLPGSVGETTPVRHRFLRERRVLLLWSLLGLVLYLPTMFLGAIIQFPPLLFGASMAWWLLISGVVGLLLLFLMAWRSKGGVDILGYLKESFHARDIAMAVILFGILYGLAYSSDALFGEVLRLLVPLFPSLTASRASVFPLFVSFYLVYFITEGLFLHVYRQRQTAGSPAGNLARTVLLKLAPYIILLAIQCLPMVAAGYTSIARPLSQLVALLWVVAPLFLLTTFNSWWLYRHTGRIWAGVVLNTLLLSWICVGLFPFVT